MSQLQTFTIPVIDHEGEEIADHNFVLKPSRVRDGVFEFTGTEIVTGEII
jgi:hypothetical protein